MEGKNTTEKKSLTPGLWGGLMAVFSSETGAEIPQAGPGPVDFVIFRP